MRCKANCRFLTRFDLLIDPKGEYCSQCMSVINESLHESREDDYTRKVYKDIMKSVKDKKGKS